MARTGRAVGAQFTMVAGNGASIPQRYSFFFLRRFGFLPVDECRNLPQFSSQFPLVKNLEFFVFLTEKTPPKKFRRFATISSQFHLFKNLRFPLFLARKHHTQKSPLHGDFLPISSFKKFTIFLICSLKKPQNENRARRNHKLDTEVARRRRKNYTF